MGKPRPWEIGQFDIPPPEVLRQREAIRKARDHASYVARRRPSKVLNCTNNPEQYARHKCALCYRFAKTYQRRGGSPNVYALEESCMHLWRAFFGQLLKDLAHPVERAEAWAWLFDDTDPELVRYRSDLCDMADVSLDGMRRVVERATPEQLRRAAEILDIDFGV